MILKSASSTPAAEYLPRAIRARPITCADVSALAKLLAQGFERSTRQNWFDIFGGLSQHSPPEGCPRYGYLLESNGAAVGVILVISTLVQTDGARRIRSNLSSWYVEPEFRSFAPLFLSRLLKNKDVTYVNISPAPHTLPILQAQGFSRYSAGQFLALANPFAYHQGASIKVIAPGDSLGAELDGRERELLLAHAGYGCLSLVCIAPSGHFPFVFRRRVVKGCLPCAQLIYCRSIAEFVRFFKPIGRYLSRRGSPFVIVDASTRIAGLTGIYVDGVLPKYYKGPVAPRLGDLAYTETAMFGI